MKASIRARLEQFAERHEEVTALLSDSGVINDCLLYTSPSPRDGLLSRMPSSA